jgi:hypothetical protein
MLYESPRTKKRRFNNRKLTPGRMKYRGTHPSRLEMYNRMNKLWRRFNALEETDPGRKIVYAMARDLYYILDQRQVLNGEYMDKHYPGLLWSTWIDP